MRPVGWTGAWVAFAMAASGAGTACQVAPAPETSIDLPGEDRPIPAEVEEHYRLGGPEGRGIEAFGRVRDAVFGPGGQLYVLDQHAPAVYVFSPEGRFVRSVGREGEGPGEFSAPVDLVAGTDGRVLIRDLGRRTLGIHGREGEYLGEIEASGPEGVLNSVAMDSAGALVGVPRLVRMGRTGVDETRARFRTSDGLRDANPGLPLLRFPRDGGPQVLDHLWVAPVAARDGVPLPTAFLPEPHWALLPDGAVAIGDSTDWRIRIVRRHLGRPDLHLRRPIAPLPITREMRQREIERRLVEEDPGGAAAFGPPESSQARLRRLEEDLRFHPERPVIEELRADAEGRLWVQRAPEASGDGPSPIDVIDSDGTYLGTISGVPLPHAFGPDGLAVWLRQGAFDTPEVVVGRLLPGSPDTPLEVLDVRMEPARIGESDVTVVVRNRTDSALIAAMDLGAEPGLWLIPNLQAQFGTVLAAGRSGSLQGTYTFRRLSREGTLRISVGIGEQVDYGEREGLALRDVVFRRTYPVGRTSPDAWDPGLDFLHATRGAFEVYAWRGSLAEQRLGQIVEERQTALTSIARLIDVPPPDRVRLVFYPDEATKLEQTGHRGVGWATGGSTLVEVMSPTIQLDPFHELTHIIAGRAGTPPPLLNEGFAIYAAEHLGADALAQLGHPGRSADQVVCAARLTGQDLRLETLLQLEDIGASARAGVEYAHAGSFVAFLIDRHGLPRFREAYRTLSEYAPAADSGSRLSEIYGRSVDELDRDWKASVVKRC